MSIPFVIVCWFVVADGKSADFDDSFRFLKKQRQINLFKKLNFILLDIII